MIASLTLRERRLIAGGLAIAAVLLAWLLVVAPIVGGFGDRADARAEALIRYDRDERAIGQLPSLRRAAVAQRRDRDRYVIAAPSATVAADRLKERLSATVLAAGGEVRLVEDLARSGAVARARLDARLDLAQLATVLTRLRGEPPLLSLDTLTVATDPQAIVTHAGPMDVRLEASAATAAPQPR